MITLEDPISALAPLYLVIPWPRPLLQIQDCSTRPSVPLGPLDVGSRSREIVSMSDHKHTPGLRASR